MKTAKRICIQDWRITAENGDHFEVERGREYITSMDHEEDGTYTVFSGFWVRIPLTCFAGAIPGPGEKWEEDGYKRIINDQRP